MFRSCLNAYHARTPTATLRGTSRAAASACRGPRRECQCRPGRDINASSASSRRCRGGTIASVGLAGAEVRPARGGAPAAREIDHSLKVVPSRRAVIPACSHAAPFETGGPSRMGTDRFVRAFRRGPCRRGRRAGRGGPASRTGTLYGVCSRAGNQTWQSSELDGYSRSPAATDALVVVVDSDVSTPHSATHEADPSTRGTCRLCGLREIIDRFRHRSGRQVRSPA